VYLLQQKRLPYGVKEAAQAVEDELDRVLTKGGNGLIIRDPDSVWEPHRVDTVLKYSPKGVK
jgi:ATP-dependent DNA ligase